MQNDIIIGDINEFGEFEVPLDDIPSVEARQVNSRKRFKALGFKDASALFYRYLLVWWTRNHTPTTLRNLENIVNKLKLGPAFLPQPLSAVWRSATKEDKNRAPSECLLVETKNDQGILCYGLTEQGVSILSKIHDWSNPDYTPAPEPVVKQEPKKPRRDIVFNNILDYDPTTQRFFTLWDGTDPSKGVWEPLSTFHPDDKEDLIDTAEILVEQYNEARREMYKAFREQDPQAPEWAINGRVQHALDIGWHYRF